MKSKLLVFLLGLAVGSVAASVVWILTEDPAADVSANPSAAAATETAPAEPAQVAHAAPAPSAPETPAQPGDEAPPEAVLPEPPDAAPAPFAPPPQTASAPPPPPSDAGDEPARRGPPRWDEMTDEQRQEFRQRFRRMHDERLTQAVDSFVEKSGIETDGGEALYAAVDGMNERILSRLQLWVDYLEVQDKDRIPPDQGAQLLHDLLGDVVQGYADIDAAYGSGWRETSPEFDLGELIDPEVFGNMMRLGGMGRGPRGGPPRGGPRPGGQPPAPNP